jgi:hypothetical protein
MTSSQYLKMASIRLRKFDTPIWSVLCPRKMISVSKKTDTLWRLISKLLLLICPSLCIDEGACGSVVGWGSMLDVERAPVRVPDEVNFFNLPHSSSRIMVLGSTQPLTDSSSRIMVLGSTQPLTEMRTRNLPVGKKRPARRAAICESNVWKCRSLNFSQP